MPSREADARSPFSIAPREAHAWFASVAAAAPHTATLGTVLSAPERRRARADRRRLIGHGILRLLLGRYLDLPPHQVPVHQWCSGCDGPHGPLQIAGMAGSMSYAADRIAFAFAREPVGIDVELVRPDYEWQSAARRVLPPTVRENIAGLPAHQQTCAFFRAWTEREALAKAVGLGIVVASDELDDAAAATAEAWTVTTLAAGPGHVASVVTAGAGGRVRDCGWVPVAQLLA